MQGVAELVEGRADLVRREQRGSAVGRARHVQADRDDRSVAQQLGLVHERRHPRPAALGGAGEPVAHDQAEPAAVGVQHLEDADVRMVGGQVRALGERQAVQPGGGGEHPAHEHALQLQVRAQVVGVDREPVPPHPRRVVGVVPRLERPLVAVGVQGLLQLGHLGPGVGRGDRGHPREHPVHGLHRPCGLVVQDVVGVAAEPEQARPLGPQRRHPGQQRTGVRRAVQPPADGGLVQPSPDVAVGQGGQGGLRGGQDQGEQPAGQTPLGGGGGGRGGGVRAQPRDPGLLVQVDGGGVGGVGDQGVEALGQRRQLRVERAQAFLAGTGQAGTGPDEVTVVALEQPQLVGVQAEGGATGVQVVDPGEQPSVEGQRVGVRGQQRGELLVDGPDAGGGVRAGQRRDHGAGPLQQPAAALQGEHGVGEGRLAGEGGDRLPLRALLRGAGRQRRTHVLLADLVERRQAVRQGAGPGERVVRGQTGRRGGGGRHGSRGGHESPP